LLRASTLARRYLPSSSQPGEAPAQTRAQESHLAQRKEVVERRPGAVSELIHSHTTCLRELMTLQPMRKEMRGDEERGDERLI
jgi:hypothetical protein